MAAIEYRGLNAVTNFDLSRYIKCLRPLQDNPDNPKPISNGTDEINSMQNPNHELGEGNLPNHQQEGTSPTQSTQTTTTPPSDHGSATAPSSTLGLLLQSSKFKEMLKQTTMSNPCSPSEPDPPRSSFPDDIQTSFDIQDPSNFEEEHGIVFGEYDSFASPMFQYELETN